LRQLKKQCEERYLEKYNRVREGGGEGEKKKRKEEKRGGKKRGEGPQQKA